MGAASVIFGRVFRIGLGFPKRSPGKVKSEMESMNVGSDAEAVAARARSYGNVARPEHAGSQSKVSSFWKQLLRPIWFQNRCLDAPLCRLWWTAREMDVEQRWSWRRAAVCFFTRRISIL